MQGNIAALKALRFEDDRKTNNHYNHLVSNHANGYSNGNASPYYHNSHHPAMSIPHPLPRLHQSSPPQRFHDVHQQYPHRIRSPRSPLSPMSPNGFSSSPSLRTSTSSRSLIRSSCNPSKKISKFCPCSNTAHEALQTTCAPSADRKLGIVILRGGLPNDSLVCMQQHCQYQVRFNETNNAKGGVLLATIPEHLQISLSFHSVATLTQYIIDNNFIRFRNRGPTETRRVSLWRIYQFEGERNIFNIWIVTKAAERALGIECHRDRQQKKKKKTKKDKNYHLAAHQVGLHRVDCLGEEVMKRIFSFLSGSKFHCWIDIHEVVDRSYHRPNLLGLEFDGSSNPNRVYVMRRSTALLRKLKTEIRAKNTGSEIHSSVFKKSVLLLKAVYANE